VRGTADETKTLSIPAKDKPLSKRYNEKAVKIRMQVMRSINKTLSGNYFPLDKNG